MNNRKILIAGAMSFLIFTGCGAPGADMQSEDSFQRAVDGTEAVSTGYIEIQTTEDTGQIEEPEILTFVDVFGQEYSVEVNQNILKHNYNLNAFVHDGDKLSYTDTEQYSYRLGVDVSHHQGVIDWNRVKADGYEFAFIRLGYRGYGNEGRVCLDSEFYNNMKNARAAGIDVGVYFFSQAISEEEAEEEADFVIQHLEGCELQLPVVYDPESILDVPARTDDVSGEQFTMNTEAFCEAVAEAGYQPMIYSNMLWEAYQLNLEELPYPVWYADYEPVPQTPYDFEFWQYSNAASVEGISGNADVDIQLIK